jgi:hypothetical protein
MIMRYFCCIWIFVFGAFAARTGSAATNTIANTVSGKLTKVDGRVLGDTVTLTAEYTLTTTNALAFFPYCDVVYLMQDKRDKTMGLNGTILEIKGNDTPDKPVAASRVKNGTAMFRTTDSGYRYFKMLAWRVELWSAPQYVEGAKLLDVKSFPTTPEQCKSLGIQTNWSKAGY